MRVLLLGGGGREHALAWKLSQSPLLTELIVAPGNPGMVALADCVLVNPMDPLAVVQLARARRVELVVIGPEGPLVSGIADALVAAGIPVFGPVSGAARLEGSKAFAKEIMAAAGVPTAGFRTFDDAQAAEAYAGEVGAVVVKADGLAGGKGVVVATNSEEAKAAVRRLAALGPAGATLVLEEVLEGEEISVLALCDGARSVCFPAAQDHKRLGEGDTGPNTGGMGAYTPVRGFDATALEAVQRDVIHPVLAELARRGLAFRGVLYAGLMLTREGPKVLEFNVRFGDPEAQVLMLQLEEDLLPRLFACARGELDPKPLSLHPGVTVGVVLAAAGYPGTPRSGDVISGLDGLGGLIARREGVEVFHAGTKRRDAQLLTLGGRVLTVCARAPSLLQARERAYAATDDLRFEGRELRRDIGARGLLKDA